MKRFIVLSFVFLGLGFFELSGGFDFDPASARASAIEARQDRDAARLAELPISTVAQNIATAAPITQEVATSIPVEGSSDEVTQNSLNLVSFAAATQPAPTVEPEITAPEATALQTTPLSEIAEAVASEPEPLSIAALESEPAETTRAIFAGNTLSSSSSAPADVPDIRAIKGSLVNMRSGPGTDYDVVDQLSQNTRVEILTDTGNGWVELRPVDGGTTGWIAEFLLTSG